MLFKQLINYNIHIGHKYKNTTLLASWMLFKMHNNLWLINLFKTVWFFKLIFNFIKILVYKNSPIWFINSEMAKQYIINQNAIDCGEFYCGFIWKRGLLSNYISMLRVIKKLLYRKFTNINTDFHYFFKTWYLTRLSWPRAVFVSNLKNYNVISKEAFTAHVPVIGMIDTNIKNYYVHFPIPSNDDSLISLSFISSILSKYIILYKYKKVILWFLYYIGCKKYRNTLNIVEALNQFLSKENEKKLKKLKLKNLHFKRFNLFQNLKMSVKFLFKKRIKYNSFKIFINIIDSRFNIEKQSAFLYNTIQLENLRKHKLYSTKERSTKFNRRFYKLNMFKLWDKTLGNYNNYKKKWYYYYFYLYFLRSFRIIINTYKFRRFELLSSIKFFYNSSKYNIIKNKLYNKKKNTWLNYQKFYSLLKEFNMRGKIFKNFNSKLFFYRALIKMHFNKKIKKLNKKPKYILTNIFPSYESFRNPYAKSNMIVNINSFAINLKKYKNYKKIIEKELYLNLLVKFINMNMRIYNKFKYV